MRHRVNTEHECKRLCDAASQGIRTDATLSPIPEAVAVENDEAEEVEKEEQEKEGGHVRH